MLEQNEVIYEETADWQLNTGGIKIVAKRLSGHFRTLKWLGMLTWLPFFLMPYLRWDSQQAILFDIANRQYHFFDVTLYPQDLWLLALTLVFFALLLAVVTIFAGRVFCGFFCFQTVWTDIFTYIETKLEGKTPYQVKRFNDQSWNRSKLLRKVSKHSLWLLISLLTGISFTAWFSDAYLLWHNILTLQASLTVWVILSLFTIGTYILAGFMREQVCFWLCPYARLQSVMVDHDTRLPFYDSKRGEPRKKISKQGGDGSAGSCVDCQMCVAVCPTGIDIRQGQQHGCITCGLCIDACDDVMEKTGQEKGLIRYASYNEIERNKPAQPFYRRSKLFLYLTVLLATLAIIAYNMLNLSAFEFKVEHERQPLFVTLSDGSIQNKYTLRLLNKSTQIVRAFFTVEGEEMALHGINNKLTIEPGQITPVTLFVKASADKLENEVTPILFTAHIEGKAERRVQYQSMFIGPVP